MMCSLSSIATAENNHAISQCDEADFEAAKQQLSVVIDEVMRKRMLFRKISFGWWIRRC